MIESLEKFAIFKKPGPSGCKQSSFLGGFHRVGLVPIRSVLDGGLPGCIAAWFCLDCGKQLERKSCTSKWTHYFVPIKQQNKLETPKRKARR